MVPSARIAEFALLSWVLIIVPGPNVLFVISRSLRQGRAAGLATVAGGQLGQCAQVVAVAFGIGALVEASAAAFTVIKLAGAAYLVFLGVQAIRHRHSLAEALGGKVEQKTAARIVLDGFMVGVTNPKVIVFFSAILPQFVDRQSGHVPVQIVVLGAIFAGVALLSDNA
ncbi:MAG: LysE family translocator, partial [Streptosporangiaceae bacterium]